MHVENVLILSALRSSYRTDIRLLKTDPRLGDAPLQDFDLASKLPPDSKAIYYSSIVKVGTGAPPKEVRGQSYFS